jgi:hypothetical protein
MVRPEIPAPGWNSDEEKLNAVSIAMYFQYTDGQQGILGRALLACLADRRELDRKFKALKSNRDYLQRSLHEMKEKLDETIS